MIHSKTFRISMQIGLVAGWLLLLPFPASAQDELERQQQKEIQRLEAVANDPARPERDRAKAALQSGKMRFDRPDKMTPTKADLEKARQSYDLVLKTGTKEQKAQAYNNLASFYLRQGNYDQALKTFADCDIQDVPKERRYVWHYNVGRAYAATNQHNKAIEKYLASFEANPLFTLSIEKAWSEVIEHLADNRLDDIYRVGDAMIKHDQASGLWKNCLEDAARFQGEAQQTALLYLMTRAVAHLPLEPEAFLERASTHFEKSQLPRPALDEIKKAYAARNLAVEETRLEQSRLRQFPWWSDPALPDRLRKAFSELLEHTGDYHASQGMFLDPEIRNPRQAFARYVLAWMIDLGNWNAAESAAWLLAMFPNNDHTKSGTSVLVDRQQEFTSKLFDQKSDFYLKQVKTVEDWEALLRMHLMLGMLYEAQGEWGPAAKPQTAIFQWTMAVRIERIVAEKKKKPEYQIAGLHARLGKAWQQVENYPEAFDHYLTASETHVQRQEWDQAKKYASTAKRLSFNRNATQERRLSKVLETVEMR